MLFNETKNLLRCVNKGLSHEEKLLPSYDENGVVTHKYGDKPRTEDGSGYVGNYVSARTDHYAPMPKKHHNQFANDDDQYVPVPPDSITNSHTNNNNNNTTNASVINDQYTPAPRRPQ